MFRVIPVLDTPASNESLLTEIGSAGYCLVKLIMAPCKVYVIAVTAVSETGRGVS